MQAEIFHFHAWIPEVSPELLEGKMDTFLEKAGFQVLGKMDHHFQPAGYTAIWLLAESHLAVHTFPEENKSYVELSSCSQEKNERFVRFFEEDFAG
jgi:S-adenosylmethionine decarboxylase